MAHRFVTATRATAAGFTLRRVVTAGLPVTLPNLVAGGLGAAVGPARAWRRGAFPDLVSRPLVRPQLSSQIGIIRLRDPRNCRRQPLVCWRLRESGCAFGRRADDSRAWSMALGSPGQPHTLAAGIAGASQPLTVRRNDGTTDLERRFPSVNAPFPARENFKVAPGNERARDDRVPSPPDRPRA